jgi:hypothetical protein
MPWFADEFTIPDNFPRVSVNEIMANFSSANVVAAAAAGS